MAQGAARQHGLRSTDDTTVDVEKGKALTKDKSAIDFLSEIVILLTEIRDALLEEN